MAAPQRSNTGAQGGTGGDRRDGGRDGQRTAVARTEDMRGAHGLMLPDARSRTVPSWCTGTLPVQEGH